MLATRTWSVRLVTIQVPPAYEADALPIELRTVELAGDRRFERRTTAFGVLSDPEIVSQNGSPSRSRTYTVSRS